MSRREASRADKSTVEKTVSKGEERAFVRTPLGTREDVLTVPKVPGFHVHFINEKNVPSALSQGYEFLEADYVVGGEVVSTTTQSGSIITKDVGGGITAYVMILADKFREEDNAIRRERVLEQNRHALENLNGESFYGKVTSK